MNKKILFLISSVLLLSAYLLGRPVLAQLQPYAPGAPQITGGLPGLVYYIEMAIAMIFGLIAVVSIVLAGILFLTAQGQPDKLQAAKAAFIWGVAGIVVGIIAYSIIAIISGVLTGGGGYTTGGQGGSYGNVNVGGSNWGLNIGW